MRRLIFVLALTQLTILLPCASAQAGSVWLDLMGGYSKYELGDVNAEIQRLNEQAGENAYEEITSGSYYGLAVGWQFADVLVVGLAYDRLNASTSGTSSLGNLELDLPATVVRGFYNAYWPGDSAFRWGLGMSVGSISSSGTIKEQPTGGNLSQGDVTGSDLLLEGFLLADVWVHRSWSLNAQAGYRYAVISEVQVNGEILTLPGSDIAPYQLDYSGFFFRLGVKFAFHY